MIPLYLEESLHIVQLLGKPFAVEELVFINECASLIFLVVHAPLHL